MSEQERHKAAMQKIQAAHRERLAGMEAPEAGLMLVYTGDGKGKSSAAFGVIVRALGWGRRVGVVQFIKGAWLTGEKQFFDRLGEDEIVWKTMGEGFTWDVQDLDRDIAAAKAALAAGAEMASSGAFDVVVLDEVNVALRAGYLSADEVLAAAAARAEQTDIVLTGRGAPPELIAAADLVTEMREIKHPFQRGIKAKRGLDY